MIDINLTINRNSLWNDAIEFPIRSNLLYEKKTPQHERVTVSWAALVQLVQIDYNTWEEITPLVQNWIQQ